MKRVLVFGGSFNPPSLAHSAIITQCLSLPDFDQVWVMPSRDRLDKRINTDDKHRLNMIKIVQKELYHNEPRLKICEIELNMPLPTQTYRTILALEKTYPDIEFWFVFGSDSYADMPNWEYGADLKRNLRVVEISRGTHNTDIHLKLPDRVKRISSTMIRDIASKRGDLSQLVSRPIIDYIKNNHLYTKN